VVGHVAEELGAYGLRVVKGVKAVKSGDKKEGIDIGDADVVVAEVRINRLRRAEDNMMCDAREEKVFWSM